LLHAIGGLLECRDLPDGVLDALGLGGKLALVGNGGRPGDRGSPAPQACRRA
jgi:hypothetical protein